MIRASQTPTIQPKVRVNYITVLYQRKITFDAKIIIRKKICLHDFLVSASVKYDKYHSVT